MVGSRLMRSAASVTGWNDFRLYRIPFLSGPSILITSLDIRCEEYHAWTDTLDDIIERMQISKLECSLALREIERDDLNHVVKSPWTDVDCRIEAVERRDQIQSERADL